MDWTRYERQSSVHSARGCHDDSPEPGFPQARTECHFMGGWPFELKSLLSVRGIRKGGIR